ncbi:MAG TPA: hypothetical protein VF176_03650 [Solirubrobacterales bacterium]
MAARPHRPIGIVDLDAEVSRVEIDGLGALREARACGALVVTVAATRSKGERGEEKGEADGWG